MKTTIIAATLMLIASVSIATAQQQIRSADNDLIIVNQNGGGGNGPVTLCLRTNPGMWKKDIRVQGVGTLASEGGTEDCLQLSPAFIRFEMVKAKGLGIMTGVGYGTLDLQDAGGARVTINWERD